MDFYVGPAPARVPGELRVEKLFDNTRVILGRKGHPLAQAKSLRELANAHWITTSITHKAEEELGPLFEKHGLPAPKLAMRAQSALTFLTALPSSDLLMMLPVQWLRYPLLRDTFQEIKVREKLPAPPVCIVQRTGLPLTPAAELLHAAAARRRAHQEAVAPTGARATVDRGPGRARSARRQRSGRIHRLAVVAQLEIQADLLAVAIAHFGDLLALGHALPFLDQQLAVVRVDAEEAGVVLDDHQVPVAAQAAARIGHGAGGRGHHRGARALEITMPFEPEPS